MKQIIFIHGGSCHPDNDTFCEALKTWNYNPFEEKKDGETESQSK